MELGECECDGHTSIGDLGRNLEEEVVVDVALFRHCAGAMKRTNARGLVGRNTARQLSRSRGKKSETVHGRAR